MITKKTLDSMYNGDKLSMMQIARELHCSPNKVVYWMAKYAVPRRSISEAISLRNNPNGDPFSMGAIDTLEKAYLFGMGIGLYWGEGTKASPNQVRLGNSDPALIRQFIRFLVTIYGIERSKLRFGLQIFTDIDAEEAISYWCKQLDVCRDQLYKPHVTLSNSIGTYRHKSRYGVMTLYFNNKRLRDIIFGALPR